MLHSAKELDGLRLVARDGEIGHASGVFFDDQKWTIRHVVARTGGWLSGRDVLISPHSIEPIVPGEAGLKVALTQAQIRDAPAVDTDKPVSLQQQVPYYDYYRYPYYWSGPSLWGTGTYPLLIDVSAIAAPADTGEAAAEGDPHLRSSTEVIGYRVHARDGEIGHVKDFLFDDRSWEIGALVVDTGHWLPGQRVLLPPQRVHAVDWGAREVRVNATRETIKAAPPCRAGEPVSDDEVARAHRLFDAAP
ncbi:MAG: PRC-barrel domain-containing protein [Rhizobacter sp.]|nr:PRC-barrel domain-containing protein [Rhizobacter sp.]